MGSCARVWVASRGFSGSVAVFVRLGIRLRVGRHAVLWLSGVRRASRTFLVFAAPFIILRNTVRGRIHEDRNAGFVTLATVIAGFWSLFAGTAAIEALRFAAGLNG